MSQSSKPSSKKRSLRLMPVLVALGILLGIGALFGRAIHNTREAAKRATCIGQNKFMGLDMAVYYHRNHRFPPAYLADKDGRPAHSWRVLCMGPDALPEQYHFDEPWDSPHNRKLAGGAPLGMSGVYPWYHCISDRDSNKLDTSYVMVVGSDTFSSGPTGRTEDEFASGASNTISVVEMSESGIPWMAPRDLEFDAMSFKINDPQGRGIRSKHPGGANVGFADGNVSVLHESIDPEVLKSLLKVSGDKNAAMLDW